MSQTWDSVKNLNRTQHCHPAIRRGEENPDSGEVCAGRRDLAPAHLSLRRKTGPRAVGSGPLRATRQRTGGRAGQGGFKPPTGPSPCGRPQPHQGSRPRRLQGLAGAVAGQPIPANHGRLDFTEEREDAVNVHQLRAGHWGLASSYLRRIGRLPTPDCQQCGDLARPAVLCRMCREEPDTPEHVMMSCPCLAGARLRLFESIRPDEAAARRRGRGGLGPLLPLAPRAGRFVENQQQLLEWHFRFSSDCLYIDISQQSPSGSNL